MAVLAKIRQRSALMIVVIAFALFAFIVPSLFDNTTFGGNTKDVGSVNGKDISFEEFRIKVSNVENSQQGVTSTAAANRVWDQEVSIALLTSEFDKLGLRVGAKHIMEVFKTDPNIGQNQLFLNDKGVFDEVKFKEYFKSNPQQTQALKDREKDAELNAKYQIYNNLIKAGLYTTEAEGKLKYEMEAKKGDFAYVAGLYSSIKDSEVSVSDAEIVDYMKKNEKQYKSDETREVEYVLIEDKASPEDEAEVKAKIERLLTESVKYDEQTASNITVPGFKTAVNTIDFVNSNSDIAFDSTYVAKKDLPAVDAEQLYGLETGAVYGPYKNGSYYCVSKSMGRKAGVNARASHILISYEGTKVPNKKEKRTKEEAKAKAEGILAQVVANPDSFLMLAFTVSDDSSSRQGGDLGYFGPNQMVKPFNDFVFNNAIGKIGLVETDFGFHIIKISEKQDGIRLATIAQKVEASEATSDKAFTDATKFEMDATANKDFQKVAAGMKLTVAAPLTVKAMDEYFGTLGNQRNIVRWAFEEDTDIDAIKRFEVANLGHVIARLKKVNAAGLQSVDLAKASVEPILKNKKKADLIKAKMAGTSLDAIAKALGSTVQEAPGVTMDNPVLAAGTGQEPKVVGTAFALAKNKISAPIEGNAGVYVVLNKGVAAAPVLANHAPYVSKLKAQSAGDLNRIIPALKELAEIKDNRSKFNY